MIARDNNESVLADAYRVARADSAKIVEDKATVEGILL